ncbi:hypothetical protein G4B88_022192 [Cannabis sativa]|uniref:Uncharacterized protein n=1 Tax=Cannabis sativa TaxID=3483 RepID=A0A7J6FXW8_CANSA|nr:hypothetical protein G4B88_022192 [Cannabis sativa]
MSFFPLSILLSFLQLYFRFLLEIATAQFFMSRNFNMVSEYFPPLMANVVTGNPNSGNGAAYGNFGSRSNFSGGSNSVFNRGQSQNQAPTPGPPPGFENFCNRFHNLRVSNHGPSRHIEQEHLAVSQAQTHGSLPGTIALFVVELRNVPPLLKMEILKNQLSF